MYLCSTCETSLLQAQRHLKESRERIAELEDFIEKIDLQSTPMLAIAGQLLLGMKEFQALAEVDLQLMKVSERHQAAQAG